MDSIQNYLTQLQTTLRRLPLERIDEVVTVLHEARLDERPVFVIGNGGSASTASHFACDLAKNTRQEGWPHFRVQALTDNMAMFSAYANDEGYEQVFAQQLASLLRPGDVVIAISTSGSSPNVLVAVELASRLQAQTIAFTGFKGGRLGQLVDLHVHVPSDWIEQVEDVHLVLQHLVCCALRDRARSSEAPGARETDMPAEIARLARIPPA